MQMADRADKAHRRKSGSFRRLASFGGKFKSTMGKAGKTFTPPKLPSMLRRKGQPAKASAQPERAFSEEEVHKVEEILGQFRLEGGPTHSTLVVAKAAGRLVGCVADEHLVHLTWYRATAGGAFDVIQGVHGGFYQPSIEDVGARICVQCASAVDPSQATFAEIGPIREGTCGRGRGRGWGRGRRYARYTRHFARLCRSGGGGEGGASGAGRGQASLQGALGVFGGSGAGGAFCVTVCYPPPALPAPECGARGRGLGRRGVGVARGSDAGCAGCGSGRRCPRRQVGRWRWRWWRRRGGGRYRGEQRCRA